MYISIAMCVCLLYGSFAHAQTDRLQVGYYDWCPYTCYPEMATGGQGYLVEIIRAVYKRANIPITLEYKPYARILLEMERGRLDLVAGATLEESEPYLTPSLPQGFYTGGFFGKPTANWVTNYETLRKAGKVAIVNGYEYNSRPYELLKIASPHQVISMSGDFIYERMFQLVALDRVAFIHDDIRAMTHYIRSLGYQGLIEYKGGRTNKSPIYITFSKTSKNAKRALAVFNEQFAELLGTAALEEILIKYEIQPREFTSFVLDNRSLIDD